MVGGGTLQAAATGLATFVILRRVSRSELHLFRSGRAREYAGPLWPLRVSTFILLIAALAAWTGAVVDGYFSWIDVSSSPTEGPLVIQALLGAEIAIVSLSATAVGLTVQLRSTSFGADIALAHLHPRRLIGAFFCSVAIIVLAIYVLGQWNGVSEPVSGLYPSLLVHGALFTTGWLVYEAASAVFDLTRVHRVVDAVGNLTLANDWQDEIRVYGWNSDRPSPRSVHLLIQAVQGAIRIADLELLERIVSTWAHLASTQPGIRQFDFFAPTADEANSARLAVDVDWRDAEFLNGLDVALAQVVRNVAAIPGVNSAQIRALSPLAGLPYPPFSRTGHHHEIRGFYVSDIPGFRTLAELTEALLDIGDEAAVRWLLDRYWRDRGRLAIHWAERLTDDQEKNRRLLPRLSLANHLFGLLPTYASKSSPETRKRIVEAIIDILQVADSRAAISTGLRSIDLMDPYDSGDLWSMWREIANIASKPHADIGWLVAIVERAASRINRTTGGKVHLSFDGDDLLKLCGILSHRIDELETTTVGPHVGLEEPATQRSLLVSAVWGPLRWGLQSGSDDLPLWLLEQQLFDFLSVASPSVVWQLADIIWDWADAAGAEEARRLARFVDGPWLRSENCGI